MDSKGLMAWLAQENIREHVDAYGKSFTTIFRRCLGATDQKVLVVGDYGYPQRRVSPILTGCYSVAASELGLDYSILMQDPKAAGESAEEEITQALLGLPDSSIIILAQSGRIGSLAGIGRSFRRFCKEREHRFISTMSLGDIDTYLIKRVINPIMVDYDEMIKRQAGIKAVIDKAEDIRITTKAGTDIRFDIAGIDAISNDGDYSTDSSGGNMPAGEVYLPPAGADGKVVIDVSSRSSNSTSIMKRPMTLTVSGGKVVSIEGGEEAALLDRSLAMAEARAKYPERVRTLAELGIGTNLKAKVIGSAIIDEKTHGTAHVAIGSNYWFGGGNRTIIHLDQIFAQPRFSIDGRKVRF